MRELTFGCEFFNWAKEVDSVCAFLRICETKLNFDAVCATLRICKVGAAAMFSHRPGKRHVNGLAKDTAINTFAALAAMEHCSQIQNKTHSK